MESSRRLKQELWKILNEVYSLCAVCSPRVLRKLENTHIQISNCFSQKKFQTLTVENLYAKSSVILFCFRHWSDMVKRHELC